MDYRGVVRVGRLGWFGVGNGVGDVALVGGCESRRLGHPKAGSMMGRSAVGNALSPVDIAVAESSGRPDPAA